MGNAGTVAPVTGCRPSGQLSLATQQHNHQPRATPALSGPPRSHIVTGSLPRAQRFPHTAILSNPWDKSKEDLTLSLYKKK